MVRSKLDENHLHLLLLLLVLLMLMLLWLLWLWLVMTPTRIYNNDDDDDDDDDDDEGDEDWKLKMKMKKNGPRTYSLSRNLDYIHVYVIIICRVKGSMADGSLLHMQNHPRWWKARFASIHVPISMVHVNMPGADEGLRKAKPAFQPGGLTYKPLSYPKRTRGTYHYRVKYNKLEWPFFPRFIIKCTLW